MNFNASRVLSRSCESLLGICLGLLADNKLNDQEVLFLETWLLNNEDIASVWPGSVIANRVGKALSDGLLTADELEQIKEVLADLVGGTLEQTGLAGGISTKLPVNQDADINFQDRTFCYTGKFLFGTRKACCHATAQMGGNSVDSINGRLDYLVIGTLVSPDWIHSSHGRKIEHAVEIQKEGAGLLIVSEEQWVGALRQNDGNA